MHKCYKKFEKSKIKIKKIRKFGGVKLPQSLPFVRPCLQPRWLSKERMFALDISLVQLI